MININVREYRTANLKKDNPEKWQHKTKKNKTKNTICVGQHYTQARTAQTRHAPSYKPLTANTNQTLFLFSNRKGHHNMELRT
jgi:hypothetical protein